MTQIRRRHVAVLAVAFVGLLFVPGLLPDLAEVRAYSTSTPASVLWPSWSSAPGSPPGATPAAQPRPISYVAPRAPPPNVRLAQPFAGGPFPATGRCSALWSGVGGESAFPNGCHGHDEPSLSFYSDRAGSGGNVTWSFHLPVDGGPGQNQSSLYTTVWFGLPLTAPGAWMRACYLEVQLYPDSSWYAPYRAVGQWTAAVVAWQIDPATGMEDWCTAVPLTLGGGPGPAMLNLTQGDQVSVALTGWPGSPWGENVSVVDLTSGNSSSVTLTDRASGAPLDPAYATSSVPGAVGWSTAGMFPAAMGFEVGRGAGAPSNNSFGGCNAGPPPSTPSNRPVPCPSYDPSSWVNDTLAPWKIHTPTFSAGASSWRPSEVAFTSNVGGSTEVYDGSHGICTGRLGSAFCSYPWFSYSCARQAFSFGATDFAQATGDFGQFAQYAPRALQSVLGVPVFPPEEFAIPSCGGSSGNVAVAISGAGTGNFTFLSQVYANSTIVRDVPLGHYRICASPASGSRFSGWFVTGAVAVTNPFDPVTAVTTTGNGTLTAGFSFSAATEKVWFNSTTAPGATAITAGRGFGGGSPPITVASGASANLVPGEYTIQSYPPPGYEFRQWTASGAATVVAGQTPVTVLNVVAPGGVAVVAAQFVANATNESVTFGGVGNGTVTFDGRLAPQVPGTLNSSGSWTVAPGAYPVVAQPAAGWTFVGWNSTPSAVQTDTSTHANVTIEMGPALVRAVFATVLTLRDTPRSGGEISIGGLPPVPNGTTVALVPGEYELDAVPAGGYVLSGWTVGDPTAAWVRKATYPITHVHVNASTTITANFSVSAVGNVTFVTTPIGAGSIVFNFLDNYTESVVNASVGLGAYRLEADVNYAYKFDGWNLTGPLGLSGGILTVRGSGGIVRADFSAREFPVTFQLSPVGIVTATLNGQAIGNGVTVPLDRGLYRLAATLAPNSTFAGWSGTLPTTPSNRTPLNATLQVTGSGAVSALAIPFVIASLTVSLPVVDIGVSVTWHVTTRGSGPFSYVYVGLPPGCSSRNVATLSCAPLASGTYPVRVNVTAATDANLTSGAAPLTVAPVPSITFFTAAPATIDVGEMAGLSVAAIGGVGPYSFNYSHLPHGCASVNRSSVYCSPSSPGVSSVNVTVTDVFRRTANASVVVTVNPALAGLQLSATPNPLTVGVPLTVGGTVAGGTTPYTFVFGGNLPGCSAPHGAGVQCTPTRNGTFRVTLGVKDGTGAVAQTTTNVTVNGPPVIQRFVVAPNPVQFGTNVSWRVSAAGGTGSLSYAYVGLPHGCATANVSGLTCAPTAAGIFSVLVTVADRFGVAANATVTLTVILPSNPGGQTGTTSGHSSSADWILIGALGLIVVLLGGYWLSRRNSPPPRPPAAPPPGAVRSVPTGGSPGTARPAPDPSRSGAGRL